MEEKYNILNKKIPDISVPEPYYECDFIDSPLVAITEDTGIIVELQYPKLKMKNAINECYVRKEVLDKLLEAKNKLPSNLTFKIWDAYRPLSLQEEIYYKYHKDIIKEFNLENMSDEERNKIINNYVALPIEDENFPPQHTTGGAIDLTLAYSDTGKTLDFGVSFDSFSNLTNTSAFEAEGMDKNVRKNRRILYNAMTSVGFTNLSTECWHFDYGDRNWASYNKKPAIYKGIFELKKEER